jgi:hypothetical protein
MGVIFGSKDFTAKGAALLFRRRLAAVNVSLSRWI